MIIIWDCILYFFALYGVCSFYTDRVEDWLAPKTQARHEREMSDAMDVAVEKNENQ